MNTGFRLRFPISRVAYWADRYSYPSASAVEAIGLKAGRRGWYTRAEFLTVMYWKTPRTQGLCATNSEADVVRVTKIALSTPDERLRLNALTDLHGVAVPTASVLLQFARPDSYPIIDFRALWSLGLETAPVTYSFAFWWAYTEKCRSLARAAGVRMRTLDKALWQYSKEHQGTSQAEGPVGGRVQSRWPAPRSASSNKPPRKVPYVGNKSAEMRRLFAQGRSVADVARALGVDYSFAFGVRKRWRASQTGTR